MGWRGNARAPHSLPAPARAFLPSPSLPIVLCTLTFTLLTLYVNSSDVFLFSVHIQGHQKSFQGKSSTQVGQAGSDE